MIQEETFESLGRKYGVSGNAVRKWCKKEHIDLSLRKQKKRKVSPSGVEPEYVPTET